LPHKPHFFASQNRRFTANFAQKPNPPLQWLLRMRLALAQINNTVGDLEANAAKILHFATEAEQSGADAVIFPELALTGYPPRDLVEKHSFLDRTAAVLDAIALQSAHLNTALILGYVARSPDHAALRAQNAAAVLHRGQIVFKQVKMLLPNYDVFDEARYFLPGVSQDLCHLCGEKVAIAICEDGWNDKQFWERRRYQRDPIEELASQGAELIVSINASPWNIGKRHEREDIFRATAKRFGLPVAYVHMVGGNDQLIFDGSSFAMTAAGDVVAKAKSFEEDLILFDTATGKGEDHSNHLVGDDAAFQALVLGTRDYIRKCGFRAVLVGLSGGIDSALVAAIAVAAIGKENVLGVGMPGPHSSEHSLTDARCLAQNLGIRFEVVSINHGYNSMVKALAPLFFGCPSDTTEENLQSRLRGLTLMALSNKYGSLVLTTGNKSEIAVGYCTLYGDMCGGLAVISDVPKTMVYRLARVANQRLSAAIPQNTFTKPPSAELRPDQRDTDSLPEYPVLDAILEAYIEYYKAVPEIAAQLNIPEDLVRDIVRKVDRNEYKRQQAAPGLRITRKAFGLGRRFPIAHRFTE
jgi:NAD+ synthase (glutamine-hydrolysing)